MSSVDGHSVPDAGKIPFVPVAIQRVSVRLGGAGRTWPVRVHDHEQRPFAGPDGGTRRDPFPPGAGTAQPPAVASRAPSRRSPG